MILFKLALVLLMFSPIRENSVKTISNELIVSDLISSKSEGVRIAGKPEIRPCKYGRVVWFNGSTDGIFLDQMPLEGMKQFTIEIIMCPESGGNFEQRFFHCGEIKGNRVLMELRSTPSDWYLDAFIVSGDQKKTFIDPSLEHPLNQWVHLAFVVAQGKQETYVNGVKELEGELNPAALSGGKTSIGVRQNEQSWFKGAIYKIKITNKVLKVNQFLKY
jgi:hypothetical protein